MLRSCTKMAMRLQHNAGLVRFWRLPVMNFTALIQDGQKALSFFQPLNVWHDCTCQSDAHALDALCQGSLRAKKTVKMNVSFDLKVERKELCYFQSQGRAVKVTLLENGNPQSHWEPGTQDLSATTNRERCVTLARFTGIHAATSQPQPDLGVFCQI